MDRGWQSRLYAVKPRESEAFPKPDQRLQSSKSFRGRGSSSYTHTYIYIHIYIYIYMVTPPHELPTLVLYRKYRVKTAFPAGPDSVSLKNYRKQTQISRERVSQLIHVRHEVRILYLSRTTEINLTFRQDMSVNSLRFDVSTKSTAALYPPNPKPTLPRENQKTKKTIF